VTTRILHLQKVAGISGSEAHLLSLLPKLKERGWDVRFLMLHEHEEGAWDFARELTARGIPLDAIPLAADVDPIAFFRIAGYLARTRPRILHTHHDLVRRLTRTRRPPVMADVSDDHIAVPGAHL